MGLRIPWLSHIFAALVVHTSCLRHLASHFGISRDTDKGLQAAAEHVPYAVLLTTTPAQVTVSTHGVIEMYLLLPGRSRVKCTFCYL